jgi:uncharacterized protein YjbI with pentapeptide repeats
MTQDPNNSSPKNLSRDSGLATNALANNGLTAITPIEPGVQIPGKAEGMLRFNQVRSAATWLEMGLLLLASGLLLGGLGWNNQWIVAIGVFLALPIALKVLFPWVEGYVRDWLGSPAKGLPVAILALGLGLVGVGKLLRVDRAIGQLFDDANWDAVGALGEVGGAIGQILIAILAVYVAWRQYVISKDLTIQQNTITQQQTIDTYFQGISDLVIDDQGLLEDWPQERAIAEGRTAAILGSVDAFGKAKVLRFLSRARLLTPLKRDQRLGRPILDGAGGYAEDRMHGVRVIDLGVILASSDLSNTDLRWTDLSDANLIRSAINDCELVRTNFARTILVCASLRNSDINGTRFFYGKAETATPRSRTEPPDYKTGSHTGAVVENADFTNVEDMSVEQRYYICAWGGSKTRKTVPGGCEGIPNKLGR